MQKHWTLSEEDFWLIIVHSCYIQMELWFKNSISDHICSSWPWDLTFGPVFLNIRQCNICIDRFKGFQDNFYHIWSYNFRNTCIRFFSNTVQEQVIITLFRSISYFTNFGSFNYCEQILFYSKYILSYNFYTKWLLNP